MGKIGVIEGADKEQRVEWAEELADELSEIDGVEDAVVDDYTSTADIISVVVQLEGEQIGFDWQPDGNLRSISQRIVHTIKDFKPDLRDYEWSRKPEGKRDEFGEITGYRFSNYVVDTYWR